MHAGMYVCMYVCNTYTYTYSLYIYIYIYIYTYTYTYTYTTLFVPITDALHLKPRITERHT